MKRIISARNISSTYIKVLLIILLVEALIMTYFSIYPNSLHEWQEGVLDVLLLGIISTPLVYLFGIRPYVKVIKQAIKSEEDAKDKLMKVIKDLEFQKKTLDEHALVSIADPHGHIIYANDKFLELSGYSEQELFGQNHRILNSGYHPKAFFTKMWATISRGKVWHGEIKNRAKNGTYYWVQATIVPFNDDEGIPFQYVSSPN